MGVGESRRDDAERLDGEECSGGLPDSKMLLVLIGFGCYFAFQSCTSFSPGLLLMSEFSAEQAAILRVVTMVSQVLFLVIAFFNAQKISTHLMKVLVMGSALGAVHVAFAILFSLVGPLFLLAVVAWALLGVSLSALGLFWCFVLSSALLRSGVMQFVKAAILNIALYLIVALMSPPFVGIVGYAALIAVSAASARVLYRWMLANREEELPASPRKDRAIVNTWVDPFAVCNGCVVGFFVITVCAQGLFATVLAMASGILGILSSVVLYRVFPKSAYNVRYLNQSTLPLLVLAVLLVPFFGDMGILIGSCITIVVRSYTQVSGWHEVTATIREFHFNPVRISSRRDIPMWTGFAIGTAAGGILLASDSMGGVPLLAFTMVLTVCLVSSYALYGLREMMIVDRMDGVIAESIRDQGPISEMLEKPFMSKCEKIIETYGLSPREAEVFFLLAKGRNAEYIQNELFISVSTARTHIYHIYKKIGVSSRQSLIDIVEEAAVNR